MDLHSTFKLEFSQAVFVYFSQASPPHYSCFTGGRIRPQESAREYGFAVHGEVDDGVAAEVEAERIRNLQRRAGEESPRFRSLGQPGQGNEGRQNHWQTWASPPGYGPLPPFTPICPCLLTA